MTTGHEPAPSSVRPWRPASRGPLLVVVAALAAVVVAAWLSVAVELLPGGPDIYAHLLWAQQVMTCLADGVPPLWLPDLNAGFGSPGIRLYSPLSPLLGGGLGLLLGHAGAGLRAGALAVYALFLVVLLRRRGAGGLALWGALLLTPMTLHTLTVRAAYAELCAIPVIFWLLDRALSEGLGTRSAGLGLALLWLLHAPSAVVVALLLAVAVPLQWGGRGAARLAGGMLLAAGLATWHWLPLATEWPLVEARAAFTGGVLRAELHLLGSAHAPNPAVNLWLSSVAVSLLAALLLTGWWRERTLAIVVVGCVALASPLAMPLWRVSSPLQILQFPSRLLVPVSLLLVARACRGCGSWRGRAALAMLLAPAVLIPAPRAVADPYLAAGMAWNELGASVQRAIGGNPLVVDVAEHRPRCWSAFSASLQALGGAAAVSERGAEVEVLAWRPLRREIAVSGRAPDHVLLRLLSYPLWRVTVDGSPVAVDTVGCSLAVPVDPGRHLITARWGGNPWAPVGLALSVGALGATVLIGRSRRRGGRPPRESERG